MEAKVKKLMKKIGYGRKPKPLKTLDASELPKEIDDSYLGRKVDTFSGLAVIQKMKYGKFKGINRPRIFFQCNFIDEYGKRCRKGDFLFLFDAAFGECGIARVDSEEYNSYDLRDQVYEHCDKHRGDKL
jgi:hypothetical protein